MTLLRPFGRRVFIFRWLFILLTVAGCASTDMTQRQYNESDELPPPGRIIVYDFTADPGQVPPQSAFAKTGALPHNAATAQELGTTAQLGAEIARQITVELQDAGLPAVRAAGQGAPLLNDVVIRGYFVSVDEGGTAKRVLVGFGSGNTELTTAVEGFQMTSQGLRLLGGGTVEDTGNKTPGMILPLAVMAATSSPVGLAVNGTLKLIGETNGNSTLEGAAKRTADTISEQLIDAAERQDWI